MRLELGLKKRVAWLSTVFSAAAIFFSVLPKRAGSTPRGALAVAAALFAPLPAEFAVGAFWLLVIAAFLAGLVLLFFWLVGQEEKMGARRVRHCDSN